MDTADFDFDFVSEERSKAAADWIVAQKGDEALMRGLAGDPTMGHDSELATYDVWREQDWMRMAREVPALRSLALSRLKGYAMVANKDEVMALAHEEGTPLAYAAVIRMLRITENDIPSDVMDALVSELQQRSPTPAEWACILCLREPDRMEVLLSLLDVEGIQSGRVHEFIRAIRKGGFARIDFQTLEERATSPIQQANMRTVKSALSGLGHACRW